MTRTRIVTEVPKWTSNCIEALKWQSPALSSRIFPTSVGSR